ncbi:MAG: GNAT family N-acetyltransferase [Sphingobacterium sp.]
MEMVYIFRQAVNADLLPIWAILQQAIVRRSEEGSDQWQDGYPNCDIVRNDIARGSGYVLTDRQDIIGYVSILVNDEPQYEKIEGEWLSDGDFVVLHRVALASDHLGKGLSKRILGFVEEYATKNGIDSIKADTNFDNIAMRKTFEKLGYVYCGQVYFRGSPRRAYEKVLV